MTAPDAPQTEKQPVALDESHRQELLNELRTEVLDRRAARLNRGLQVLTVALTAAAVFLTALAVTAAWLGLAGFQQFKDIRNEAQTAQMTANDALDSIDRLRSDHTALKQQVERDRAGKAEPEIPNLFTSLGFEFFADNSGVLASGDNQRVSFSLSPGEYRFTADCDDNCTDLDLVLYRDDNEEPVDEDLLLDAFPIVSYEADRTRTVLADVVMVTCSEEPCAWSLNVYRRD